MMNMNTPGFFETESGSKIPLVPGYRELFPKFYWDQPHIKEQSSAPQQPYDIFLNHVYKYSLVIDLLRSMGCPVQWNSSLELGASEGTISRMFACEGRVTHADTVDHNDLTEKLTSETFSAHVRRLRKETRFARFSPRKRERFLNEIEFYREMRVTPPQESPFWTFRARRTPEPRALIKTDLKDFQPERAYDLVLSFLTLIVLDLDMAMERASASLKEDGLFVVMEPCWWYPYLFFGMAGVFPYAFQRLDGADLRRYVETYHSEDANLIFERLTTFKKHTVCDYVHAADRHNLSLLGMKRIMQTQPVGNFRAKLSAQYMNAHDDARLCDVLGDIRAFRPDVQFEDLLTPYVLLVFRKQSRKPGLLSRSLGNF